MIDPTRRYEFEDVSENPNEHWEYEYRDGEWEYEPDLRGEIADGPGADMIVDLENDDADRDDFNHVESEGEFDY